MALSREAPAGQGATPGDAAARIDGYMEILEREFGDRFDEAARARIREQLKGVDEVATAVSRFPLKNGDEPGSIFRASPA